MVSFSNWASSESKRLKQEEANQQVTLELGENPCQRLTFQHEDGTRVQKPCNAKRCYHCGPRQAQILQHQLEAGFGDLAYVHRYDTREELDRDLARVKKQEQRNGSRLLFHVTGDESYYGFITVTDSPLRPGQRRTALRDWTERIVKAWRGSAGRLRRSRVLGTLSRVPIRKGKSNSGQPSMWTLMVRKWVPMYAIPDTVEELFAEIEVDHHFRKRDMASKWMQQKRMERFVASDEWVDPA